MVTCVLGAIGSEIGSGASQAGLATCGMATRALHGSIKVVVGHSHVLVRPEGARARLHDGAVVVGPRRLRAEQL